MVDADGNVAVSASATQNRSQTSSVSSTSDEEIALLKNEISTLKERILALELAAQK